MGWGEVDILAENPRTKERWIVEVRGKRSFACEPVDWLSSTKVDRLKRLAQVLTKKSEVVHRILFVQVHVKETNEQSEGTWIKARITEFEVDNF